MALDVSGLVGYINEDTDLIAKIIVNTDVTKYVTLQDGIKTEDKINILDINSVPQNSVCGWNPLGNVALTQESVKVFPITIQDEMCLLDLEKYYTQLKLNKGSYVEEFGFEALFTETLVANATDISNKLYYLGDTGSADAVLSLADGLVLKIDNSGLAVTGNTSGAVSITPANVIDLVNDMIVARPSDLRNLETYMHVGQGVYDMYIQALIAANMYHVDASKGQSNEFIIPGTNVTMIAVKELNASNRMFILAKNYTVKGCDLDSDISEFRAGFDEKTRMFYWSIAFKVGAGVAFPDMVVEFSL